MTLQGGKCNFNLRTLGILNLLALGPLGPGLDFGIWELAKVKRVCKERWGPEVESGISESWVCKERWGPELESGISESWGFATYALQAKHNGRATGAEHRARGAREVTLSYQLATGPA